MKPVVLMALEDDLLEYGECHWEVLDKYNEFRITRIEPRKYREFLYSPNTNSAFTGSLYLQEEGIS